MSETSKLKQFRDQNFYDKYLKGDVIDIGAGNDPVTDSALIFEKCNGDANHIDKYFINKKFDAVYASHLLEHLNNPYESIKAFSNILKNNGYIIIVIPIYELYEQNIWPSIFNDEHKWGFSDNIKSNNHIININDLNYISPNLKLISSKKYVSSYDFQYKHKNKFKLNRFTLKKLSRISLEINNRIKNKYIKNNLIKFLSKLDVPFDQSSGEAICSLELIFQYCE